MNILKIFTATLILVLCSLAVFAQTTTFNYQGRLNNGGMSANGNFDFEFRLYDQGAGAFPGANRFLEIAVRLAGGGAFTTLLPRQQILSTPYAIKSLTATISDNSTQLGGVDASRGRQ